jgi:hypothetical protein
MSFLTDTIPGVTLLENLSASFAAAFLPDSMSMPGSTAEDGQPCEADCPKGLLRRPCLKLCELQSTNPASNINNHQCNKECSKKESWFARRACNAACDTNSVLKARSMASELIGSTYTTPTTTTTGILSVNFFLMLLFIAAVVLAGVFSYRFNTILGKADLLAKANPKMLKMCADIMVPTWLFSMTPFVNIGLAAGLAMSVSKLEASIAK